MQNQGRQFPAVALLQLDVFIGNAQSVCHDLRKCGLVPLPVRLRRHIEQDTPVIAEFDLRALLPRAPDAFQKIGDPEPADKASLLVLAGARV